MNHKWPIVLAGLLAAASLTGCANSSTGPHNGPHTQNAAYQTPPQRSSLSHGYNAYTQGVNEHNYRNGFTANGFNQDMAERLTRAADDVPGVDRATVVVSGSDAVIGIRPRSNLAPQQVKVIEQQVHSAARSVAPSLNIRVTSDHDMFGRIRGINEAIYQGATNMKNAVTSGPNTVSGNLANTANDFTVLLRDLGRTVTAPFR